MSPPWPLLSAACRPAFSAGPPGYRAFNRGGDADHLALQVAQRSPGVAGVDRRVGLDHAAHRAAPRLPVAVHGADDTGGHAVVEAEGIADGDHFIADFHRAGV